MRCFIDVGAVTCVTSLRFASRLPRRCRHWRGCQFVTDARAMIDAVSRGLMTSRECTLSTDAVASMQARYLADSLTAASAAARIWDSEVVNKMKCRVCDTGVCY